MSSFDAATLMGLPSTGVYHSFNGKIFLGGYPIVRISRANFTISNGVDLYVEVGSREGIVYAGNFDVRGSITRAYVNGAEWRLAIGMTSNGTFDPGLIYTKEPQGTREGDLDSLVTRTFYSSEKTIKNPYPIKTDLSFDINQIDDILPEDGTTAFATRVMIKGILIDVSTINVGRGGDLITSGPINWVGERATLEVVEAT